MPLSEQDKIEIRIAQDEVMKLFDRRCAGHGLQHSAVTTHEITPRSKLPRSWWKDQTNLIPLCAELHEQVHQEGTRAWQKRLRAARKQSLILLELGY